MRKQIINGQEITVQEREDWKTSIDQDFKPGDYFDEEIAWDLIECLPPHRLGKTYFQCGEPHSHTPDAEGRYRATYLTLVKVSTEPEVWKFQGYLHDGEGRETTITSEVPNEDY